MSRISFVALAVAAAFLCGCTASSDLDPPAGQKAKISHEAMAYFKDSYQANIGSVHLGAFAVSVSGHNASYAYCPHFRCKSGYAYGQQAIARCESFGERCYLFAIGNEIEVDYEVVD